MMFVVEMVQDGVYFRANGFLECGVKNGNVYVLTKNGKTDYGVASKTNFDAILIKCCKMKQLIKDERKEKKEFALKALADLMCYYGQQLIIETVYYRSNDADDEGYESWFKCYAGGNVNLIASDRSISLLEAGALDITDLVSDIIDAYYDADRGISDYGFWCDAVVKRINKLSLKHYFVVLFPPQFIYNFEKR